MKKINLVLLCNILLLTAMNSAEARRFYVKANATGTADGNSWATAYPNLFTTLSLTASGDEVWVAAGTYYPKTTAFSNLNAFILKSGVAIYGGFAGTETALAQRNFTLNECILQGTDGSNKNMQTISAISVTATAKLDGFKVVGGKKTMIIDSASPTISNCTITNSGTTTNADFIYQTGSTSAAKFQNCTIRENTGRIGFDGGVLRFIGCNILYNQSDFLFNPLVNATLTVDRCSISGNTVTTLFSLYYSNFITNSLIVGNVCTNYLCYMLTDNSNNGTSAFSNNTVAHNSIGGSEIFGASTFNNLINNSFIGGNNNNTIRATYGINTIISSNVASVPKFVAPASSPSDAPFNAADYDYRLQGGSALINAGDNNYAAAGTDLDNNPRVTGANVDVGAYEFGYTATMNSIANSVPLKIMPNPVSNICTLDLSALDNPRSLQLSDMSGKLLLSQDIKGAVAPQIDLSAVAAGVYTLQVITETYTTTQKVSVVH